VTERKRRQNLDKLKNRHHRHRTRLLFFQRRGPYIGCQGSSNIQRNRSAKGKDKQAKPRNKKEKSHPSQPRQDWPSPPQTPQTSSTFPEFGTPSQPKQQHRWLGSLERLEKEKRKGIPKHSLFPSHTPHWSKVFPLKGTPSQPRHDVPSPPQMLQTSTVFPELGTPSQPGTSGLKGTKPVKIVCTKGLPSKETKERKLIETYWRHMFLQPNHRRKCRYYQCNFRGCCNPLFRKVLMKFPTRKRKEEGKKSSWGLAESRQIAEEGEGKGGRERDTFCWGIGGSLSYIGNAAKIEDIWGRRKGKKGKGKATCNHKNRWRKHLRPQIGNCKANHLPRA